MYKLARIVIVFSVCLSMFVSAISVSALYIKPCEFSDLEPLDSVTVKFVFPLPIVSESLRYDSVEMQGLASYGAPGEPVLPFKTAKVLIPQGKEMQSIHVSPGNKKTLGGKFNVEYGRTPIPVSSKIPVLDKPNRAIYSSSTPFPGTLFSHVSKQYLRGYEIVLLTLHPVQYVPKTGELFHYETMIVTVDVKETDRMSPLFRNLPQDKVLVLSAVDNPEVAETYIKTGTPVRPTKVNSSKSYDYVIITNSDLNSSFQPLIDRKIGKGLNATIVLIEDILNDSDYFCDGLFGDGDASAFNDTAARIRNFVKDAYQNWGTEYVLLGGDTEIIPTRGTTAYVPTEPFWEVDFNIPCDMYFGALDGSWNNDNDTKFGEGVCDYEPCNGTAGEEADFWAEVYIGRATVETTEEAGNFVNKTLWYEQATDDEYFKKALWMGENLDEETEGANSKDLASDNVPQYTMTRLYERDGTYPSKSGIINHLNSGPHLVNHDGHSNKNTLMNLEKGDVDNLTNTEYFFLYTVGCYAAAFDGTGPEAIAEHFIFNPNGSFALIGNSRYGWYSPGTSSGPGDRFDQEFWCVVNNTVQNMGMALQLSKESEYGPSMSGASRWTYFNLNLLGDPETEIVTEIMAPTAHFKTVRSSKVLRPPVLKGDAELRGTAKRGTAVGATFDNFTIKYGVGRDPSVWNTLGMNLVNGGQSEITNDALAIWNTRLVTPYSIYTLKLTVYDGNGRVGEDRWIVKVEPPTTVQVDPQLTEILVPLTFTVDVEITNVEDLYELEIYFSWNTTLMDYVSHTVYSLLNEPAQTNDEVNQTAGTYWIWSESQVPASPFDGSGTVFKMTFQAKAAGTSILNISSSELLDSTYFANPIAHDVLSGTVQIGPGVHDVAVTDASVSRTVAPQGLSVGINVTVENQGSYAENFNVTAYSNETAIDTIEVSLNSYSLTVLTFTWNTTGVTLGNYTISANATVVLGETNVTNNNYVDGMVSIVEPSFDVAVVDINLYKTIVGEGYSAFINVTVENQADLTCTFNVTVYADLNVTTIGDEIIIGLQNVTLTGGNSTIITFVWNTTGTVHGNYTISAYATPLPAEADLEDNTYIDNWIIVTIPGDVDGDFDVDLFDAVKLLKCYGAKKGQPSYDPHCDIDGDGDIDLFDAIILLKHYGQKDP